MVSNVESAVPSPLSPARPMKPSPSPKAASALPPSPTQIDDLSTASPPPPPPAPSPATPTAPVSAAPKKKKKRKNAANPALDEATPLPNEASIRGDSVEQWRARALNRRALLAAAQADVDRLSADLAAALARVSDAEHAEATVNKGLLTARAVITQRDRALAELTSSHQELKGEHAKVVEDKKRGDKRLVILKTVSANLQEAREAREVAERKLEDAHAANAKLRTQAAALKEQVEALKMVKQQLAKREVEVDELVRGREEMRVEAKKGAVRAAGIGAAGVVGISVVLRVLGGGRRDREE